MPDYEKLYYALFSDLSRIIDILEIVRQNAETREKLEAEMKETYGCSTVEELKAFAEKKSAEADKLAVERDEAFNEEMAEIEDVTLGDGLKHLR